MMPVIRIDDEVQGALEKEAIRLRFVFKSPNDVLRAILKLDGHPTAISGSPTSSKVDSVETLLNKSSLDYNLIPVRREHRSFFPGYKVSFELETDAGMVNTHVTSAARGTAVGDPQAGDYLRSGLGPWYNKHAELAEGARICVEAVEPGKRYKLSIVDSS